jgi:anti-sigma factor (TIGR02949 family)
MKPMSEMLDCATAAQYLYDLLDEELTPELEVRVRTHFEKCERCFPRYTFERNFQRFLSARTRTQGAPEELKRRIFEQTIFGNDAPPEN